jgi:tetratricopeptide (TPR) repeat protein
MSVDRDAIQDAINRALKAANRALRGNEFNKVAEIYFRVAYMLNELGDAEGAQQFATAAKEFKLKNQIIVQIHDAMKKADTAYSNRNYSVVADNYFMISNLAELLGDKDSAAQYKTAALKFQESIKAYPQVRKPHVASMGDYVAGIQSQIPSSVKVKASSGQTASGGKLDLNSALKALGLVCSFCGTEVNPDLAVCPKCNRPLSNTI